MTYRLFIDDERWPPINDHYDYIVRSFRDATDTIKRLGLPSYISFDHDLGANSESGAKIAAWIVDYMLDNKIKAPFQFYVHSQNPIGKKNIEEKLNGFFVTLEGGDV